jgi:hypothetical protein
MKTSVVGLSSDAREIGSSDEHHVLPAADTPAERSSLPGGAR